MDDIALKFARYFATTKHGDQKYSGGLPYTHHLAQVEAVMRRFGTGMHSTHGERDMLVACWLHDVVEDTGTKLKEIREFFGEEVTRLVAAVTDEPGPNRKIRKALTLPKIRAGGEAAVRLKLADRIANLETGGSMTQMYRDEYEDFYRTLHTAGENEDMWGHIGTLLAVKAVG